MIDHDKDAFIEIIVDGGDLPDLGPGLDHVMWLHDWNNNYQIPLFQDKNHFQAVEFYAEWTLMPSNVSYQVTFYFFF